MNTNTWQCVPFEKIKIKAENKLGENISKKLFLYALAITIVIYATMCASFKEAYPFIDIIDKVRYICAFAILIKIYFLSNYNLKQLCLLSVLYIYLFLISLKAYDPTLLFTSVMIFGAKDIDYKEICKCVFFTTLTATLAVFLMYSLGVLNDVPVPRGTGFRHSFGFAHPNTTGLWILCCVASFCQYFNEKIKLWHYGIILAIALLMYVTANSRASFMSILLITVLYPITTKSDLSRNKIYRYIGISAVISIFVATAVFMLFYNEESSWQLLLDKLFSYRLSLSHAAYENYGIHLFANPLPIIENSYILDCMNVRIVLTYGLVALAMTMVMFIYIQNRAFKHNCGYIAIMCFILLVYSLMEVFPYNAVFNVTLFAVNARLE